MKKWGRYLKLAREFKRWALSSKVERVERAEMTRQKEMVLSHAQRNTERQRVLNNIAAGKVESERTLFENEVGASGPVQDKINAGMLARMKLAEIERFRLSLKAV